MNGFLTKNKYILLFIPIVLLSLNACQGKKNIYVEETETIEKTDEVVFPVNNCGSGGPIKTQATYDLKIDVRGTSELGVEAEVVKEKIIAALGVQSGFTIRHELETPPGTMGEHIVTFQITVHKGLITREKSNGQATYTVTAPKAVSNVDSSRLVKCPNGISPDSSETLAFTVNIINVASGKSYSYFPGNLTVGATVYSDRDYVYSNVPSFLNGKNYIATSNSDLFSTETNFLTFSINKDAIVYVAHDDRYMNKPPWLNNFQDTGADLEYIWRNDIIKLSLYGKEFSKGQVVLGGNVSPGENANNGMYTVIIVEK